MAAVKALFESLPPGEPYTSKEIAAELDCAQTTAYKKLQTLVESGDLETKKVGARGRVWWLPLEIPDEETAPATAAPDVPDYPTLLARELQYHAVFEEAFDAIVIADDDAKYVDVNPAACALFGLPREDLLGKTILDFTPDGYDFEQAWSDFQASDLERGLFPLVPADGEERIVEFAATPNVLPGRHLSVLRDVTEKSQQKAELQRERELSERYQRSLAADSVIELQFAIDNDVFGVVSERLGCRIEFEGVVPTGDGRFLHYVTITGGALADVAASLHQQPQVNTCRLVHEADHGSLFELDMVTSPIKTLLDAGAYGRSLSSESGVTTVLAEVGADVRIDPIVSAFTEVYPTATFVAKRTLTRPLVTTNQYRSALTEAFTERQRETLKAAYLSGYFDWPRASDAETIASSMGIASSTWLRHLRRAESKLVSWLFEELEA